jgi:hypothetical protein
MGRTLVGNVARHNPLSIWDSIFSRGGSVAPGLGDFALKGPFPERAGHAKKSVKEGLPNLRGLFSLPNYFADAVLTAGGNNSWLRAATQ